MEEKNFRARGTWMVLQGCMQSVQIFILSNLRNHWITKETTDLFQGGLAYLSSQLPHAMVAWVERVCDFTPDLVTMATKCPTLQQQRQTPSIWYDAIFSKRLTSHLTASWFHWTLCLWGVYFIIAGIDDYLGKGFVLLYSECFDQNHYMIGP